jgi:hypothetical protein
MKYIKSFDNFKPNVIKNQKPYKVKKNMARGINFLQKRIKSLRRRLDDQSMGTPKSGQRGRFDMNRDKNDKIQKLKDLQFKQLQQAEYLRANPIKENSENKVDLKEILSEPNLKDEDLVKYIGLDEKKYKFKDKSENWKGFIIEIKEEYLERLTNSENGIFSLLLRICSDYNDYSYYVDDYELNYIHSYISGETFKTIEKLSQLFDYHIDMKKEGDIKNLFKYLGLKNVLEDIKTEISYEHEYAIELSAKSILKSFPFELSSSFSSQFQIELEFEYDTVIKYIEDNKLSVSSIKEFLENVNEINGLDYNFEDLKYDFLGDFKGVSKAIDDDIEDYLDSPDDIFPRVIAIDNIELMKDKVDLANFTYIYDIFIDFNRKRLNLFDIAKHYNKEILKWFKTYDFQKMIINESNTDIYIELKKSEIIDPKIEEEYSYLEESPKYNL